MASPTVRGTPTEGAGASATTHTITFAQNTGDRVVIFFAVDATARTLTIGDSFVNLTNTSATFHIFTKVLAGSEGGDCVITAAVATKSAWIAYNITTATHASATAPVFSTVATGTSTAPESSTLSPSGGSKDYLWLSAFGMAGEELDDDTWCNSAPTSFTGLLQKATGTTGLASVNCEVASAQYAYTNSTLDPTAFSVDVSLAWRAYTVAVYPYVAQNLTATAADSISSLSEAAVGVKSGGEFFATAGDALGTLADAVARGVAAKARTTGDSLATLSEAAARGVLAKARTAADEVVSLAEVVTAVAVENLSRSADDALAFVHDYWSATAGEFVAAIGDALSAVTEATGRAFTGNRAAADALSTLADAVVRLGVRVRATGDQIVTLAETTARAFVGLRPVGDALASLSEAVVAVKSGANAFVATVGDALATLAETATRGTYAIARGAGDALATLAESAVRGAMGKARAAGDALVSLAEAAVRAAGARVRTSADALGTLSEGVARLRSVVRVATDAVGSLSEVAVRGGLVLVRGAGDALGSLAEALASVWVSLRSKTIWMDAKPGPVAPIGDVADTEPGSALAEADTMATDGGPRLAGR